MKIILKFYYQLNELNFQIKLIALIKINFHSKKKNAIVLWLAQNLKILKELAGQKKPEKKVKMHLTFFASPKEILGGERVEGIRLEKTKIVDAISKAGSVNEAKTIFETLQSTVESKPRRRPETLGEAIRSPSSVIRASRNTETKKADPVSERMKKLAGII